MFTAAGNRIKFRLLSRSQLQTLTCLCFYMFI